MYHICCFILEISLHLSQCLIFFFTCYSILKIMLHYISLCYMVLHNITLYYVILRYTALQYSLFNYIILYSTCNFRYCRNTGLDVKLHCIILQHIILHGMILQYTILHYILLSYIISWHMNVSSILRYMKCFTICRRLSFFYIISNNFEYITFVWYCKILCVILLHVILYYIILYYIVLYCIVFY